MRTRQRSRLNSPLNQVTNKITRKSKPKPINRNSKKSISIKENTPAKRNKDTNEDQYFETLYTNIKSIPNYSAKINEFLRKHKTNGVHQRVRKRKFPRRRIIVHHPFQIFMADLIEYTQPGYEHANRGYRYILVVIDIFSKMIYTKPVKRKNKFAMALALDSILSGLQNYPNTLITDEGLEFYNKNVRNVLDEYGMHHYSIHTKMKASVVERVIRTLKERFEKYFYENKTKNWLDILDQFTSNYNKTPHRSIGMAPVDVTDANANDVFNHLYPDIHLAVKPRLAVGDVVRLLESKTLFNKGYTRNWSEDLFKVRKVKSSGGRVWYKVEDLTGNKIPGIKYYWQLSLVTKNDSNNTSRQHDE